MIGKKLFFKAGLKIFLMSKSTLKWVNELQHDILSQLIFRSTLGITRIKPSVAADVSKNDFEDLRSPSM